MFEDKLVSVCCVTYNHQDFIEKCIDGFLMQKTTFPVEFLIADDASVDKNQEKILKKVENHDNFKLFLREENLFQKGELINIVLFKEAKGKYSITQEEELSDGKKIDLRFLGNGFNGSIPTELKIVNKWTGPSLFERLENQLCNDLYAR